MDKPTKIKLSPKLVELCRTDIIDSVNQLLDSGENPSSVCRYINSCGFKISVPLVYNYKKIRQQCIVNNITIEHLIGVVQKPIVSLEKTPSFQSKKDKLKSELDALDKLIERGYKDIDRLYANKPVPSNLMLQAISLKNSLTEGSHGFLTNYGIEALRDMEKSKYELILSIIMTFIPQDKKDEVLYKIELAEDNFYQKTEYYEEYLKAKGLSEEEINRRLYDLECQQNNITDIPVPPVKLKV